MEKALESISGIIPAAVIDHGILGQQNLSRRLIILSKKFLIDHHQPGLADSRAGLLLSQS